MSMPPATCCRLSRVAERTGSRAAVAWPPGSLRREALDPAVFFHLLPAPWRHRPRRRALRQYSTFPIVEREETAARLRLRYRSRDLCLAWMNASHAAAGQTALGDPKTRRSRCSQKNSKPMHASTHRLECTRAPHGPSGRSNASSTSCRAGSAATAWGQADIEGRLVM